MFVTVKHDKKSNKYTLNYKYFKNYNTWTISKFYYINTLTMKISTKQNSQLNKTKLSTQ